MNKELAAQLLNNRDALENIAEIRQRLKREKTVIDSQLQAGADAQMSLLASGAAALANARARIDSIDKNMTQVHSAHKGSFDSVKDFNKLQRLSAVVGSFDLAHKFVENFTTLRDELAQINTMMDQDGDFDDIEKRMDLLLPIHYSLDQLRQVKEQAAHYASQSTEDVRQTIGRHFAPLDRALERFDITMFNIADTLLDVVKFGDKSLVVRLAKVIDFEERRDLIAATAQKVDDSKDLGRNRIDFSTRTIYQTPGSYPKRFLDTISKSVDDKFTAYMEKYSPEDRPDKLVEKFDWVFKDLYVVREELVALVPERWNILDIYVSYYHAGVHRVLNAIMKYEPSAAILLQLLDYSKDYYKTMESMFKMKRENLTPPLLDGREKELYDDFLALLVKKLKEWYQTVSVTEMRPFVVRSTAPDSLDDNTLVLNTHTDMAKLVSQQLEAAAESGQGRIVMGCVDACCDILVQRQQGWIELVDQEVTKEISGSVEDVPPGLFEYLIALANEQDRAHEFLTDLANKWSEPLSKKYKASALSRFEETNDGYTQVALAAVRGMVKIIFNDMTAAFGEIYVSNNWKNGVTISQIVGTLTEYLEDAHTLLLPDFFLVFLERLTRDVALEYLRSMANAQGKVKVPQGRDRILEDVKALYGLFTTEQYGLEPEVVRDYFKVFGVLTETLDTPLEEMATKFQDLREMYWDAPLDLFEYMIGLRKGIDKRDVRVTMAQVRLVAVQAGNAQRPAEATEMGEELPKTFLSQFRKQ